MPTVNFPDTVFRIAGLCGLSIGSQGGAIPVLESVENEGTYFVQTTREDIVVDFVKFKMRFERIVEGSGIAIMRSDPAIYCFVSETGPLFATRDDITMKLRELLEHGLIEEPALLDAAYIMNDDVMITSLLDNKYFKLAEIDFDVSRFFLINNVLRDRVLETIYNENRRIILLNTEIDIVKNSILIRFPDGTDKETEQFLRGELDKRIALSKAFKKQNLERTDIKDSLSNILREYKVECSFDFPFSGSFIQAHRIREIFVPLALIWLRDSVSHSPEAGTIYKEICELLECYKRRRTLNKLNSFMNDLGHDGYSLFEVGELCSLIRMSAEHNGIDLVSSFSLVRCCVFYCRSLNFIRDGKIYSCSDDLSDQAKLYSINLAYREHESDIFNVPVVFRDYIGISTTGSVQKDNFSSDLEFGIRDNFLQELILSDFRRADR